MDVDNTLDPNHSSEDSCSPSHDPELFKEKLIYGFQEFHEKTVKKADLIRAEFKGGNPSFLFIGHNQLDELGLQVGQYIEETSEGSWPKEVLTILAQTMKYLVETATAMKSETRAFDVLDHTGTVAIPNDGLKH